MRWIFLFFISLSLFRCTSKSDEAQTNAQFKRIDSESSGITFVNQVVNQKETNIFRYRNFYNGGGVATGDINNDGLPDLYFTSNQNQNVLYLNEGDLQFKDISQTSKTQGSKSWSTGVVMVDINGDGWLDIYVCNAGDEVGDSRKNELFINNQDLTFTEAAADYGLDHEGISTHAAFFDYDNDGDLDVYLLNNSFIPVTSLNYENKRNLRDAEWDVPSLLKGGGDKLLQNNNGKYEDVTEKAGIYSSLIGFGLGVTVSDFNNDALLDIYVSNDFYERDYLYINRGDGTFSEELEQTMPHISLSSMGADIADINNDGWQDVFVTDMLPGEDVRLKETTQFEDYDLYQRKLGLDFHHQFMQNALHLNLQGKRTAEIANYAGVSKTDWSWGALLFDMDNDGFKDIYVSNGIQNDLTNQDFMNFFANDIIQNLVVNGKKDEVQEIVQKMPSNKISNYAFRNKGDLSFTNATTDWGLDEPSFSNGASYADLDLDGDLDLVVNNVNQEAFLYENQTKKSSYIQVKLKGNQAHNPDAIGAKVELFCKEEVLSQELIPSRGFQSSVDYVLHFGLGKRKVDSVYVHWPSAGVQRFSNLKRDTLNVLTQGTRFALVEKKSARKYFKTYENPFDAHQENLFNDFDREGLIAQMLSQEGPAMAVADLNGDEQDDVIFGGSAEQSPSVWLQNTSGTFVKKSLSIGVQSETTAIAVFDANGDGKPDILLGMGGNQPELVYDTQLWLNQGAGNFVLSKTPLPQNKMNKSVIAPYDFDGDGDIDVFIGSRSARNIYGARPKSQFWVNDGKGNFTDEWQTFFGKQKELGMITDAKWVDMQGDGNMELVVIQDWGTPLRLAYVQQNWTVTPLLEDYSLLGRSLSVADVNKDGLPDLLLGTLGSNAPYTPSLENPMQLWVHDFDLNGTVEQIVTQNFGEKQKPIQTKHEITAQVVSLRRENLKFADYATKSIQEIFEPLVLSGAEQFYANSARTVLLLNGGNGSFQKKELPPQANFSSTHAAAFYDFDGDGNLDILLGGNDYEFRPQFTRLDSSYGTLLMGDGKGDFRPQSIFDYGVPIFGEVKHILPLHIQEKSHFLVGINNQKPLLLQCE